MTVRVLIVDDSATMRAILRAVLMQDPDIEVVGAAADAAEARVMIRELNPDVVTLDIEMPGMSGLEFLEKIMTLRPMPVIVVSSLTAKGADTTMRALQIGAFECYAKPAGMNGDPIGSDGGALPRLVHLAARHGRRNATAAPDPVAPPTRIASTAQLSAKRASLIAIGSSTGGVEALSQLLSAWPADCPPTLIVQHIFGSFATALTKRLDSICAAKVVEAEQDVFLQPGHIYVAPGGERHLIVRNASRPTSRLVDLPMLSGHRPSVDMLFKSVATALPGQAVGIILTGMGSDGARGMLEMRNSGCLTIAQDKATALVYGMPRAAVENGAAREELPLSKIGERALAQCRV